MPRRSSSFRRWLGIPMLVAALSLVLVGSAQATYTFVTKWGGSGSGNGRFDGLDGISVGNGNVYASDFHNERVERFSSTGVFGHSWPTFFFDGPNDVAVSGNVYYAASTYSGNQIEKFNASTGALITSFAPGGSGNGQVEDAEGVATNPNGTIVYVVDYGASRIDMFSPTGEFYGRFGSFGSANGQFNNPQSVAVAPNGNVYVADSDNERMQEFTSNGTFIRKWTPPAGSFNPVPNGVAVDSQGFVYVTDRSQDRVYKFTSTGAYLEDIGAGHIDTPIDVAVDANGYVYIADDGTEQVQKWAFVKQAPHSVLPPKIAGQPHVGSSLTCKNGSWSGSLPITYSYRWFRNASQIGGATTARYAPKPADKGKKLTCQVTGKNAYGTATSKQSAAVKVT